MTARRSSDHTDLLHQRPTPYRPRVHDDAGRCDRPVAAADGGGRVFPDRHRRARAEGRARGAEGRPRDTRVRRRGRRAPSGRCARTCRSRTTTSSGRPSRAITPRRRRSGTASQKAGDIYKGEYEGWYCSVDELFVPEAQLVDDKCPTCGSKVERLKEESYYFRLSKYQQPLLDWYRDHPDFVQPEFRLNEVRTFVEAGLAGPEHQPHVVHVGRPGARRSEARDVRVVRRADQLPHRARLRLGHAGGGGAHRASSGRR